MSRPSTTAPCVPIAERCTWMSCSRTAGTALTALTAAVGVLRGGGLVAVFPEGTRTSGEVAAAQGGAAWLARTAGAVVLPVVCRGTARPPGCGRRWRPQVDVLVGEPLALPSGGGRAGLTEATEVVRVALVRMISELDEVRRRT